MSVAAVGASVLEAPELAGYRDLWSAATPAQAARFGIAHEHAGGFSCAAVAAAPGSRLLNHCLGLPLDRPLSDDEIAAVERFFASRWLPVRMAAIDGSPAGAQLAERGYVPDYAWVKFVRDASPPAPVACDLEVRPLAPAEGPAAGRLVMESFGLPAELAEWYARLVGRPGWHVLGAFDGSALAATGALFVHAGAGWVTFAATDPAHRGRAAQKALLAARIALAPAVGADLLVVETGERGEGLPDPSYRNILGAGFRPAFRRPFWRLDPR